MCFPEIGHRDGSFEVPVPVSVTAKKDPAQGRASPTGRFPCHDPDTGGICLRKANNPP